jgi:glycosyltransferase involved in cell wall biosynthesis
MNILYTITSYPPAVGGAQLHTHQLASHLAQNGHRARVVTHWDRTRYDWLLGTTLASSPESRDYSLDGVPVHRIGLSRREKLRLLPFVPSYWLIQGLAIREISALLLPKLAAFGSDCQVVHNVRIGREALSYASLQLARTLGVPFVFTPVHHPRWGGWFHRHYHALYRAADVVIALTHAERQALIGLGVQPERIHITGIGPILAPQADGDRFRLVHGLGSDPIVLFLGTHYPYKGWEVLLSSAPKVWERFPAVRFLFVGSPTPSSRRSFSRQSDPRLMSLGAVDLQAKTDALAACDLLCVPSTQESFGGVYTEAWLMGKPVVGADIPALREVISDGQDGYLVRPDPWDLADRLCLLLGDVGLRQRMGEAGRTKVLQHYTWDRLAERTLQVYRHALSARELSPRTPGEG